MLVPALVLEMQRQGLGTVDTDLFWEELPQSPDAEGVWVVSRGDAGSTENSQQLSVDIYARFTNKLTTETRLRSVVNWVRGKAQDLCRLSVNPHDLDTSQPNETINYVIYSIQHVGAVQNQGVDENGRILKTITVQINFNEGGQEWMQTCISIGR